MKIVDLLFSESLMADVSDLRKESEEIRKGNTVIFNELDHASLAEEASWMYYMLNKLSESAPPLIRMTIKIGLQKTLDTLKEKVPKARLDELFPEDKEEESINPMTGDNDEQNSNEGTGPRTGGGDQEGEGGRSASDHAG